MNFSGIRLCASTETSGKKTKGSFCLNFWIYILCRFSVSQRLSLLSEAGWAGWTVQIFCPCFCRSGITTALVLSKREREDGKPKETQPLHPNCAPDWFFREKKMEEAWKSGAVMEVREHEGNISEFWSSSRGSPWEWWYHCGWVEMQDKISALCLGPGEMPEAISVPRHWILFTFSLVSRPALAACPGWAVPFSQSIFWWDPKAR